MTDAEYQNFLNAEAAGRYSPDLFLVRIMPEIGVADTDGRIKLTRVTLHEYIHFLHNVSTIAGLRSFLGAMTVWTHFRSTVGKEGTSAGADVLDDGTYQFISSMLRLDRNMNGDCQRDGLMKSACTVNVTGYSLERQSIDLFGQAAQVTIVILNCTLASADSKTQSITFRFGYHAILEGIASETDRRFGGLIPDDAPPVPYQVLRALAEHIAPGIERITYLKLAVLSLQANDPAGTLLQLLQSYAAARENADPDAALRQGHANISASLGEFRAAAMQDLDRLAALVSAGTRLGSGLETLISLFRAGLMRREREPWFELDLFAVPQLSQAGADFISQTPCFIIEEGKGPADKVARDVAYVWGEDAHFEERMSIVICAIHFMKAHLSPAGIRKTSDVESKIPQGCPFYTNCTLPLRTKIPSICSKKPWRSMNWEGWDEGMSCWYGSAVTGSIGKEGA